MAIEIVDLPIKKMISIVMLVYQRVNIVILHYGLLEGT